jgi:hypothetical protein
LNSATAPVVASFGTVTATCVLLITLTLASCAEPIQALLTPVKLEPVTVITVPAAPVFGVNFEM